MDEFDQDEFNEIYNDSNVFENWIDYNDNNNNNDDIITSNLTGSIISVNSVDSVNSENSENPGSNSLDHVVFHKYFCKEFVCIQNDLSGKKLLSFESSDQVILPTNSLDIFARRTTDNLYLLRLFNPKNSRFFFVGISEFSAPDRSICIPVNIMKHLDIDYNSRIDVDAISVPIATFAQIKIPEEIRNIETDIKVIIEYMLRNHYLLFIGKKLEIKIFEKTFVFEVTGLKPCEVGSIINSDIELEIV